MRISKIVVCFLFLFLLISCSNKRPKSQILWGSTDTIPPAAILDLDAAPGTAPGTVDLSWTAVGDDGLSGYAAGYILKYSTTPISESNFNLATTYVQTWSAGAPGQPESKLLTGFTAGVTYYFALKVQDEVPNVSPISNIISTFATSGLQALGWIGGNLSGWSKADGTNPNIGTSSFASPRGVALDSSGYIYVADQINHRICKWDSSGTAIGWLGGGVDGWQTGDAPSAGADYRSFDHPRDVFVDSSDTIYVSDSFNKRISKWSITGNALGWIGGGEDGWKTELAPSGANNFGWFNGTQGIFVDSLSNIFIADNASNCIRKWSIAGNPLGWIGSGLNGWQLGDPDAHSDLLEYFRGPMDVVLDSAGNLYIADQGNNRISKWNSSGKAIGWLGGGADGWQTGLAPISGALDYQSFNGPISLCLDSSDNIYVLDQYNYRVSKWASSGNAIGWFGGSQDSWHTSYAPLAGIDYQSFSYQAFSLHFASGSFYIADEMNHRISKWHE